jgi:hypothetical protein
MSETDNQDQQNSEQNKEDNQEDKNEGKSALDEIKETLEETKKTLAQITEERKRVEKATAEMLVNGKTYAGQTQQKPREEKLKEDAINFWKGTGIDEAIKRHYGQN